MQLDPLEAEISRTKRELNELCRQANLASREGRVTEAHRREVALLEKELENIEIIARYIEPISAPVARDLRRWHAQMSNRFRRLKDSGDAASLRGWVAHDLVPHLRRSEQLAHLVATNARRDPKKGGVPFVWPVAVRGAMWDAESKAPSDAATRRA